MRMVPHGTGFGSVHQGFFHRVCKIPLSPMLEFLRGHPGGRVCFTGHSLGGACSTILCSRFLTDNAHMDIHKRVFCVTFASPMCGLESLAATMKPYESVFHHYVDKADIVPKLLSIPGLILRQNVPTALESISGAVTLAVGDNVSEGDIAAQLRTVSKPDNRSLIKILCKTTEAWTKFQPMGIYHILNSTESQVR